MNKALSLVALAGALAVAGCTSSQVKSPIDSFTYRNEPLVKDVEKGMTRQEVLRLGGEPSDSSPRPNRSGLCHDYILSVDGKQQPYHVTFDGNNRVDGKGFSTCSQAERN